MSVFVIGDLHLSFGTNKPMDIFGDKWKNHEEKLKQNWESQVRKEDTVILLGDFSWAMYLEETYNDFKFLNSLKGNKILLKGNHDYWWETITKMNQYLKENNFENIDFLYNNSFLIENKIIVGTRGWINSEQEDENEKLRKRENLRLVLSIEDGIKKYGKERQIIACMHYPPFQNEEIMETLKKYRISRCVYGHLHGESYKDAIQGSIDETEFNLVSGDYLSFRLLEI